MRGKSTVGVVLFLLVVGLSCPALDLTGSWSSALTFAAGSVSPSSSLTLRLATASWVLSTTLNLTDRLTGWHTLAVKGSLGGVGIEAGATFTALGDGAWVRGPSGSWTARELKLEGAFLALEFTLGNFSFRLSVGSEPGR